MQSKLDPFHLQIVSNYLSSKQDYLNIIQVNKNYQYLLDRFRINPIPITEQTKNLFQYLNTQQIFNEICEFLSAITDINTINPPNFSEWIF